MNGYKAFENDLSCRGFQYEIGRTYTVDGEIGLCENGFHICVVLWHFFKGWPR